MPYEVPLWERLERAKARNRHPGRAVIPRDSLSRHYMARQEYFRRVMNEA